MNSTSEVSFGARVGNAESLLTSLTNFVAYQPLKPEFSIENFGNEIRNTKGFNNVVAEKKQNYSLALEKRIQVITKGPGSIEKRLAPINGTVKAIYGKTSKEAKDIAGMIAKYRGANITVPKTATPADNTVSQSYQSYNSKLQFFADIIVNLSQFGDEYITPNNDIKPDKLQQLYQLGVDVNNEVVTTFTQFSQENARRMDSYKLLSYIATGIKESVKAQYGVRSTEYKLIKGLKI